MIYKLQNGGIIKLQNAGSLPKWMQKLNSWSIPDSDESAGERILNSTIEQANKASTQEERDQIYKDSAKKNLAVTGQSLMMLPMLGEFTTYGLLGGGLRLGTGIAGSKAGEYVLGKGGDWLDKQLHTKFLGTTGRIIGGLGGWWGGSSATTPLFRNLAGKGITLHMPQETFMNLRGQYFDRAAKNIKLDAAALPKLQYHDRLMKDYLEFGPDSNIHGDNISKLVHWDPMTTGTKSALPINGGFSRDPIYFPHFENGKLVPAIGQIRSKLGDGHLYAHPYHPIFFGANRPWWEVPKSNLSDVFLESTTVDKSIYSGPKQNFKRWYRRQRKYARDMRKWYEKHGPQNRSARYLITDPENLADYEFNYKLGTMGSEVPMSKLEGFEYDPLLGTFKRARYTDPSTAIVSPQETATTYHFNGRIPFSKPISEAERLGIPKALRSNPKALEDPYYWGYKQWNDKYNAAVESGNIEEGRRLYNLHEARNAPNTQVHGDYYHGTNNAGYNIMDSTKNPGRTVGAGEKTSNFFSDMDLANAYLVDAQGMGTWYQGPGRLIRARLNIKNPYIFDYEGAKFNGNGGTAKIYNHLTKTFKDFQNGQLKYFPTESDFIDSWRAQNKYLGKLVPGRDYTYSTSKVKPEIADLMDNIIDRNVYDGAIIKNINELDGPVTDYVTFTPNQVKLSNIITYDNYGNMIPIVKRHNYHNPDMRYKKGGKI